MEIIKHVFVAIIIIIVLSFIEGVFVMLLWNWLMPSIFGLCSINFWQGIGISVLSNLLFGKVGSDKD